MLKRKFYETMLEWKAKKGPCAGTWSQVRLRTAAIRFIQTDWLLACGQFLASTGRRRQ